MSTASKGFGTSRHASIAESSVSTGSDKAMPMSRLNEAGSIHSTETASTEPDRGRNGGKLDEQELITAQQMTRVPKVDRWQTSIKPSTPVNRQPVPLSWIPQQLDPASREVFEEISTTHTSNGKLKFAVTTELERSAKEMEEDRGWMQEAVSYGEFLTDLLHPDECFLLHGQSLPFNNVIFHVCEEWVPEPHRWGTHKALRPPVKRHMLTGRAFLTNHRLILFSAEKQKSTSLKRFTTFTTGRDTPKPVGYQLRATSQDMVHFQSIPLTHFRNVELLAAMGTSSVTNILGQKLFCCLPLVCCRVCYEDDMCSKYWYARDHLTLGINSRMLSMGVILPPWGNRSLLEVHAQPDVPLSLMKGFMKELQRFAPGLRTAAQKPQENYT